jgi:hypothetical protein
MVIINGLKQLSAKNIQILRIFAKSPKNNLRFSTHGQNFSICQRTKTILMKEVLHRKTRPENGDDGSSSGIP